VSQSPSPLARTSAIFGCVGAALLAIGPVLIQLRVLSGFLGFRLFMFGALVGVIAAVLGLIALWLTRPGSDRSGRGHAAIGAAMGIGSVVIVLMAAGSAAGLPAINDITTSPDDPPEFHAALTQAPNTGRDLAYPGDEFAQQQRAAYPDLAPIQVQIPPDKAFGHARDTAASLGWEIIGEDAATGVFEATETTRVFRFVDDVVVRVRPAAGGAVIDVRSKSRDGRGDMGANAARIRNFRAALKS
jgi:uncharacterized protein (DUF1499 family)